MSERILALVPAYNEAEAVGAVVLQSLEHLPVLVVDDGSSDQTGTRAEAAGASLLTQDPNQGKGAALRAGFSWALSHGYEAVVTLDADGQHDPAEIPEFLSVFELHDSDLIIGARNFDQMPLVRRISNSVGRKAFSWALRQEVADNQSGYRLISRRLMETLLASDEQGFEFEVEMIVICAQSGYRLDWVPIRTIYAGESSHIRPVQHVMNFARVVINTRKATRPRP